MLREVLKDSNLISLGKSYSLFNVYYNDVYLGEKHVCNDGKITYHVVKVKNCITNEANLIISRYFNGDNEVFGDSVQFSTVENYKWEFAKEIVSLINAEKELSKNAKEYTSLKCIKRYSFNGDGVLDCEMYADTSTNHPCYIVNHHNKTVSACHGFCYSGFDVAKKLNYKFVEY